MKEPAGLTPEKSRETFCHVLTHLIRRDFITQQDNDTKHTAYTTQHFIGAKGGTQLSIILRAEEEARGN